MELEVTDYDVIIAGSNLIETMLAGALARAGKTVLHLDDNEWCVKVSQALIANLMHFAMLLLVNARSSSRSA